MTRRSKPAAPLRAVIDPSWILRALLISEGEALGLRRAWQQHLLSPLVSPELAATLMRALAYPKLGLSTAQQQELLADFLPYAEVVKPVRGTRIAGLADDKQSLIELAIQGHASLLLCDDKHLSEWSANSRGQVARQLCTVRAISAWFQVLPPSQSDTLLC
ncbi:PIN domain-containing protein [Mitsuaria sp. GD03876]|uniref:PIN domain-containing protein n=1 Tax=Mitsuaria sp. GD03876 TaxID=2975399 RepID=UPI0024495042|nr:PIN domain-containing protein [Mitsuaria sp. GD03876]MDH0863081.1 PIN domain-containing protein [Mitsuaria sp. GD03876]